MDGGKTELCCHSVKNEVVYDEKDYKRHDSINYRITNFNLFF